MDADQLIVRRLAAQLLSGPPAADPVEVAQRLLAIQAQDQRGFRLAIRVRTAGPRAAAVDRALSEERSLVVTWLNRGTLHLVRTEDYRWLQALTTPRVRPGNARRLAQICGPTVRPPNATWPTGPALVSVRPAPACGPSAGSW